jgi:hypothetical protein
LEDRAHEQDDREHHQGRGDDRSREADLPARVKDAAAARDEHEHERAE